MNDRSLALGAGTGPSLAVLALMCAVSLSACTLPEELTGWAGALRRSGAEPREFSQSHFPLATGFRWQYEFRDHAGGGEGDYAFELISRGIRPLPETGRDGVIVDEISPQGTHPTAYYVDDGFLIKILGLAYGREGNLEWTGTDNVREFGWKNVENQLRMLPEELEPGTEWADDSQVLNARVRTSNHAIRLEAVETPAGTFAEALRIDSTITIEPAAVSPNLAVPPAEGPTYWMTEWYARDVGLVRSITKLKDEQIVAEIRLVRAVPPGEAAKVAAKSEP
jgi:hypothetical protein